MRGMLLVFGLLSAGCGGMAGELEDQAALSTQEDTLLPACQRQAYTHTFYDGPDMRRIVGIWRCRCGESSASVWGTATAYVEEEWYVCR